MQMVAADAAVVVVVVVVVVAFADVVVVDAGAVVGAGLIFAIVNAVCSRPTLAVVVAPECVVVVVVVALTEPTGLPLN